MSPGMADLIKKIASKPNLALLLDRLYKDANYYFGLFKRQGFISKKKIETIRKHEKTVQSVRELIDQDISLGHCFEKLINC